MEIRLKEVKASIATWTEELQALESGIEKKKAEKQSQDRVRDKIEEAVKTCVGLPTSNYPAYISGLLIEERFDNPSTIRLMDAKMLQNLVGQHMKLGTCADVVNAIKMAFS